MVSIVKTKVGLLKRQMQTISRNSLARMKLTNDSGNTLACTGM